MPVDPIAEWLHGWLPLVIAVGALASALAYTISRVKRLLDELRNTRDWLRHLFRNRKGKTMPRPKLRPPWRSMFVVLLFALPAGILTARGSTEPAPPNVIMMKAVWDAFNKAKESKSNHDYQATIDKADALLQEFEAGAVAKQKKLIDERERVPKEGTLAKEEKERVWGFGPLHEVAAAWLVKGRAFEALGKDEQALASYEKAEQYPHALIYDPSWNGFWAPAPDAKARKEQLLKKRQN